MKKELLLIAMTALIVNTASADSSQIASIPGVFSVLSTMNTPVLSITNITPITDNTDAGGKHVLDLVVENTNNFPTTIYVGCEDTNLNGQCKALTTLGADYLNLTFGDLVKSSNNFGFEMKDQLLPRAKATLPLSTIPGKYATRAGSYTVRLKSVLYSI